MGTLLGKQGSLLWRLPLEVGRHADLAFADLDNPRTTAPIDLSQFRAQQIAQLVNASPILLVANASIALGFARLAYDQFAPQAVLAWTAATVVLSLLLLAGWWRHKRRPVPVASLVPIRQAEFFAAVLGLIWAAFPALFFDGASDDIRILAVGLTFAISGIGAFALASVPTAAILFCSLIAGSLALTSVKLGGEEGLSFGFFAILYAVISSGMILGHHRSALARAAADQELRKQKDIVALLLNDFEQGTSDWLWETDRQGHLTYFSARLAELLGRKAEEIEGQPLPAIFDASAEPAAAASLTEAMSARQPFDCPAMAMAAESGTTCWNIKARPLFGDAGDFIGYRGVARDITEESRAGQELIRAKETAERASAAKSQFLAVMSHELKTPLNAIVGFAELLTSSQANYLSDDARADHLQTILQSGRHLQSLINDILDATRIEKGTMKLIEQEGDAAELIEVAVKMCRDAAERADTTIVARIVDGIEVKGDITRIKQVLINLVTNAAKFSAPGAFVNVGLEKTETDGLAFVIRDDGIGIRKEDIARIFEPFVQADEGMSRRFGGVGLGLAIARKIAQLHGGDIIIESDYGQGTTARFVLPSARVAWPSPKTALATAAA